MTAKKGFIPRADGYKKTWAANLQSKIGGQAAAIGLVAADVNSITSSCSDIVSQVDTAAQAQQAAKQATATKIGHVKADETNIRTYVKRIKANAGYNSAIGQALGIIGEDHEVDEANSKPALTLHKDPHGWRIEFNLQGHFDGVNIYKKLAAAADFTFLARDTSSPYIDNAAVDNGTQYYAYYVMGDDEVGLISDLAVVSV